MAQTWYRQYGKRTLDLSVSVPLLVLLSPMLLGVAVLVRWKLGSPVVFVQQRPGRHGRSFRLMKFRTMTDARDHDGQLLPDDLRMTAFGRFLRASSLDELPELWNVVRGEMSLVGPRPLLERYLPLYTAEQMRRHDVRPGITGWAQINGRNRSRWDDRLALDVWYVDHVSLRRDLKILFVTVIKVVRRDDISADGCATMPAFTGSETRRAA
ncbi:MAG: sugar transferase [Planctomycetaceae bacterium]|nr:sugar transferase [Planctomycetaceae bacterium]